MIYKILLKYFIIMNIANGSTHNRFYWYQIYLVCMNLSIVCLYLKLRTPTLCIWWMISIINKTLRFVPTLQHADLIELGYGAGNTKLIWTPFFQFHFFKLYISFLEVSSRLKVNFSKFYSPGDTLLTFKVHRRFRSRCQRAY